MNEFEKTIKAFLDGKAESDSAFAEKYANAGKDVERCCKWICGEVKKTGRIGFDDAEIYGMAVHFFDEGGIEPANAGNCRVVVNHAVKLTDEEKAKIYQEEKQDLIRSERAKAREKAENDLRREQTAKMKRDRARAEKAAKKADERRRAEERAGMLFSFDEI